jgi:hypothetical protein
MECKEDVASGMNQFPAKTMSQGRLIHGPNVVCLIVTRNSCEFVSRWELSN